MFKLSISTIFQTMDVENLSQVITFPTVQFTVCKWVEVVDWDAKEKPVFLGVYF